MTIHFHGTPITPGSVLQQLAGKHFCVSYAAPDDVERVHQIGQSVLLDNGAFTFWKQGGAADAAFWRSYYTWCERWLEQPTTAAIIPDVIDAGSQEQDALLREWPFGHRGWPVWHMDEPLDRLLRLCDEWPKVAIGSTAQYRVVGSAAWSERMTTAFNEIARRHRFIPWLHMLRGMQCVDWRWPFASVDSTDVARNHNRGRGRRDPDEPKLRLYSPSSRRKPENRPDLAARRMADRWDGKQTKAPWIVQEPQPTLPGVPGID